MCRKTCAVSAEAAAYTNRHSRESGNPESVHSRIERICIYEIILQDEKDKRLGLENLARYRVHHQHNLVHPQSKRVAHAHKRIKRLPSRAPSHIIHYRRHFLAQPRHLRAALPEHGLQFSPFILVQNYLQLAVAYRPGREPRRAVLRRRAVRHPVQRAPEACARG